jgi:DNA mismatch repair protein MutL
MSKIRILPEQLANQIAAGEVVERPASVVKELLENSLDASSTRIEIEIEGGGTRLIRIIDNGEGMDEDDVLLSLERHGTSKIRTDADLIAIGTLGFRGEAIPSIGSVSKMTITSRRAESALGTRAEIQFGNLIKVHEAGCGVGTIFEIQNLFGKTPARKKFLRTVRTELNHIDEVVRSYALANPEITFSLSVDGKRTLYLDNTLSLEQRLAQIMNYSSRFITIGNIEARSPDHRVYGFLVPPEKLHTGPARLRLFVNGRAIKDRMMSHAAAEGLRGFLMKGKNPAGLLHLILPAAEVDVNVHPAKHEVRFRNSRDVHYLISQAVAQAMQQEQKILQTSMFGHARPSVTAVPVERTEPAENPFTSPRPQEEHAAEPEHHPPHPVPSPKSPNTLTTKPQYNSVEKTYTPHETAQQPEPDVRTTIPPALSLPVTAEPIRDSTFKSSALQTDSPRPLHEPSKPVSLLPEKPEGHGLQIIGQFGDLYIFCRSNEGLLVIDQHAAHERLLYEELRKQYLGRSIARQNLLFPETVELTLFQLQLVEKHTEELEHMGFTLREFGGNAYLISAVPALAGKSNPSELLIDVLEQFGSESNRRDTGDRIDTILATMACKAAVKAGTALSLQEMDALLNRMAKADLFSHCPHGRPVVKQFSQNEIKKWFYRT